VSKNSPENHLFNLMLLKKDTAFRNQIDNRRPGCSVALSQSGSASASDGAFATKASFLSSFYFIQS
jgi:hypothetical protein